ncbi:hypothetical protein BDQ17DRAFT_1434716 [Cyathus striatus]|nr:hypothetical protein BDQ17DRAFT_1434716 [Cyathus striatus]
MGDKAAVGNYAQEVQPVLQKIIDEYEVHISTYYAYPSEKMSMIWMREIWEKVMEAQEKECILTEDIRRLHPKTLKGYCQNPIILNVLHETWFKDHNADGAVYYAEYFTPLSHECLALIFMALSFAIEEWSTGSHKPAPFTEKAAQPRYNSHVRDLMVWGSLNFIITEKMHIKLADHSAGVDDDEQAAPQLVGDVLERA